jgi:hypothetical protein
MTVEGRVRRLASRLKVWNTTYVPDGEQLRGKSLDHWRGSGAVEVASTDDLVTRIVSIEWHFAESLQNDPYGWAWLRRNSISAQGWLLEAIVWRSML